MPLHHKVLLAGVACLVFLAVYVPWVRTTQASMPLVPGVPLLEISTGYYFIWDPPSTVTYTGCRVDVPRTLIPMGVVVLVTLAGAWVTFERKP